MSKPNLLQKQASNNDSGISHNNKLLSFLWLEITRKCNLRCVHCYADSAPNLGHGQMTTVRWKEIIGEAYHLGVRNLQFIGGEPTLHPDFFDLVNYATYLGFSIEVYSNLTHISPPLWNLFQKCNISIATSFYSLHPNIHNKITHHNKSQKNTLDNIKEALRIGLPIRVGIIEVFPDQDISDTENMLRNLGITRVGKDRTRRIGRGLVQTNGSNYSIDELCGSCDRKNAAIDPDGNVYPCVFSRWLSVGNIQNLSLYKVVFGKKMADTKAQLNQQFALRQKEPSEVGRYTPFHFSDACSPDRDCSPHGDCSPDRDCRPRMDCRPLRCNPLEDCRPYCFPGPGHDD